MRLGISQEYLYMYHHFPFNTALEALARALRQGKKVKELERNKTTIIIIKLLLLEKGHKCVHAKSKRSYK